MKASIDLNTGASMSSISMTAVLVATSSFVIVGTESPALKTGDRARSTSPCAVNVSPPTRNSRQEAAEMAVHVRRWDERHGRLKGLDG
jgi:hypothetical protein